MTIKQNAQDTRRRKAEAELTRLGAYSKGDVGIVATHLKSSESLSVADSALYPPCSAVKMPLALALLDKVDRGELKLDQLVEVRQEEMNPVGIGDDYPHGGVVLSLANLLEATITRSCNTATDVLFRLVGGPPAVMAYLERVGLREFQIQRTMRVALAVLHELPLPADHVSMRDYLRSLPFEVLDARNRTNADFHHDQRDMCTPRGMQSLLVRLWNDELLKPATRNLLVDIMGRTVTGANRLQGRLPQGVPFASKSGSGAGSAVDVGFLTLPDGKGTVAISAFVAASPLTMAEREAVLADVGRFICDYFMLVR
ncbi:MAG: serine hydrolase [Ideonella sp.]|nr:serine hydrolase [Ideonella sp.]